MFVQQKLCPIVFRQADIELQQAGLKLHKKVTYVTLKVALLLLLDRQYADFSNCSVCSHNNL